MDGHRDSWQAHKFRGIFQLIYQQVSLLVSANFQICLAKELGRDSTSTWLMQQKVAMTIVGKAEHFGISMLFCLNEEDIYVPQVFYSSVQRFSKLLGTKSLLIWEV